MRRIYLDHTNMSPTDPRVLAAVMNLWREGALNASVGHRRGRVARETLENARREVAGMVGCREEEVIFTASATEANNLALKGICRARGRKGHRLLISAVEHPSILHPASSLSSEGMQVEQVPVDHLGRVDSNHLQNMLDREVTLVSVMHANPEVGTLQPIRELAAMAREAGALFHTDATVSAGHFPGLWRETSPDLMTLSPHLFYGPPGIAALIVRNGVRIRPQEEGGTQEGGRRAGTECIPLMAGFAEAARISALEATRRTEHLRHLESELRRRLESGLEHWVATGDMRERVPGHLSLCVRFVEGEAVLADLDEHGIEAGSGSACTRELAKESHVLKSMGVEPVLARGSLQFGFGPSNGVEDVEIVAELLPKIVSRLREISPFTPRGETARYQRDE